MLLLTQEPILVAYVVGGKEVSFGNVKILRAKVVDGFLLKCIVYRRMSLHRRRQKALSKVLQSFWLGNWAETQKKTTEQGDQLIVAESLDLDDESIMYFF